MVNAWTGWDVGSVLRAEAWRLMDRLGSVLADYGMWLIGAVAVALAAVLMWKCSGQQMCKEAVMSDENVLATPITAASDVAQVPVVAQIVLVMGGKPEVINIQKTLGPKELGLLYVVVGLLTAGGGQLTLERAGLDVAALTAEAKRRMAGLAK